MKVKAFISYEKERNIEALLEPPPFSLFFIPSRSSIKAAPTLAASRLTRRPSHVAYVVRERERRGTEKAKAAEIVLP